MSLNTKTLLFFSALMGLLVVVLAAISLYSFHQSVRTSDMVIRYGGEEFLIVLLDTGAEVAMNVAEKIRAKVEETKISLPGTMLQKTISIGVLEFPSDTDTFWQVVKFADVALYEAKSQGRNRVIHFIPSMWTTETGKY